MLGVEKGGSGRGRDCFSRKGRKERKGNGEVVVESKSLYNRFVDFAFFVVKNWKSAKDAESAKGMGKEGGRGRRER